MADTSLSLLDALKDDPDGAAWQQMMQIYSPLIRGWARRYATAEHDIDDLVQEVLMRVMRKIPEFVRQPRPGAFRRWLRSITVNCLRESWRANRIRPRATGNSDFQQVLGQLANPSSGLSKMWDEEHDRHVTERLLAMIKPEFSDKTWRAFKLFAIDNQSAREVGEQLGMSVNAVFIAKSRVLSRLRALGRGLIE